MTTSQNIPTPTVATNAVSTLGIVLAGGKSSRMGRDKAALCIDGEPLLLRARQQLLAAGCGQVLMSGAPRAEWPETSIADALPETGPVGGIISTLHWARQHAPASSALLFIPVDAPLLSPALLHDMLITADTDGCRLDQSPLPLVIKPTDRVLNRCAAILSDLQSGRSCSIKHLIAPLDLVTYPMTNVIKSQLINVNTPTEWEGLCRELENRT